MNTEHSRQELPQINLDLLLDSSIANQLDLNELQNRLAEDMGDLLRLLGIPGEPHITVESTAKTNESAQCFLRVTINDQTYHWVAETLYRGYHYLTGEVLDGSPIPNEVLKALEEKPADQLNSLIRLVVVEAVKSSPAALLTPESVDTYRTELINGGEAASIPDTPVLQSLLAPVLNLGISIADTDVVKSILNQGFVNGWSPIEISESLIARLRPDVVEVHIPHDYLEQLTVNITEGERGNFRLMRDGLFDELGLRFPGMRFVITEDLQNESARIKINDLPLLPFRGLRADECLVNETPDRLKLLKIEGKSAINPANQSFSSVINTQDAELAEEAGLTTWNQLGYLILSISADLRAHAAFFLDSSFARNVSVELRWSYQYLVDAVRKHVPLAVMTQALRLLLAEQISIRNMRQILGYLVESRYTDFMYDILDPDLIERLSPGEEWLVDPVNLASYLRVKMKRYISYKYQRSRNLLVVYLLDKEFEEFLDETQTGTRSVLKTDLDPDNLSRVLTALRKEFNDLPALTKGPVILTTPQVRPRLRELIAQEFPKVVVLSYHELAPDMNIQPVARISLN